MECVEENVDFDLEAELSGKVLAQMKNDELNAFNLFALKDDFAGLTQKRNVKELETQTGTNQASGKRRDLTKDDILKILAKHNIAININMNFFDKEDYAFIPSEEELYTFNKWIGFIDSYNVAFCSSGLYFFTETFFVGNHKHGYLSYDDLRNSPEKAKEAILRFKDWPEVFVKILFKLQELE